MDDRQTQIREGAGLEEARLNVELVDWLKRFSTPILGVIGALAFAYLGYNWYQKREAEALDAAFVELAAAQEAGRPEGLVDVAVKHASKESVAVVARLTAADLFLDAYRVGLRPGAELEEDGRLKLPEDRLNEEQRRQYLANAEESYRWVVDRTAGERSHVVSHVGALFGLAAALESRGEFDEAKGLYDEIVKASDRAMFNGWSAAAKKQLETLDGIKGEMPKLWEEALVAVKPNREPVQAPGAGVTPSGLPPGVELKPVNPPPGAEGVIDVNRGPVGPTVEESFPPLPAGDDPAGEKPAGEAPAGEKPAADPPVPTPPPSGGGG